MRPVAFIPGMTLREDIHQDIECDLEAAGIEWTKDGSFEAGWTYFVLQDDKWEEAANLIIEEYKVVGA